MSLSVPAPAPRTVVDEETGEIRVTDEEPSTELLRVLHKTIAAVREDYATLGFNTAIVRLTELNNAVTKLEAGAPRSVVEQLILMTSPLAPHICEELWSRLGHEGSLAFEDFPVADPALLVEDSVTCVVQIRGKVRDRLEVPADITEEALREQALALPKVQEAISGGVRTVIVRAPKLVNIVPA